ncbi:MerR family transcriptional regulator [Microbacterium sp. NPDC089698]|uniref:MerR family transcriptional regulator n=1 Tax=Microbacterium sp. NPDC089698 TaxID=3364200 RepID=UPI003800C9B3
MDAGQHDQRSEMSVGELAMQGGVKASSVRFWDDQGLLTSHRSAGNQRRFTPLALAQVRFIRWSQEFGASLPTIRDVLQQLPEGTAPGDAVMIRAAQCWRRILDQQSRELGNRYVLLSETVPVPRISADFTGVCSGAPMPEQNGITEEDHVAEGIAREL